MRIAIFASLLGVEATGQSMYVANTATRLMQAGHQVTVIATDCGYQGARVTEFVKMPDEIKIHVFPANGKINRKLYRSAALIAWVEEHVGEFDILDVQGVWSYSGMAAARIFAAHNKPYILTPHGVMTRYDWQKGGLRRKIFFRLGFGQVWRKADAIRFLSQGERHTSYYPASGRSAIIPNAIQLRAAPTPEIRHEARAKTGILSDSLILLFVGRITHQKGVKEIVAAFEVAAPRVPGLLLYLIGPAEGEYGEEVLAMIRKSPVADRIVTTGAIFGDAKYDYLRSADAFITLSHNEGMSIAHLEALAEGLPMILTESSNLDYLEEYGAGVLATHDLANASQTIQRVMSDPALRANASRQARRLVEEKFAWEKVTPQLIQLYEELIAAKRRK